MTEQEKINIDEELANDLAEFMCEVESYLYDWTCSVYKGKYLPVDHRSWTKEFRNRVLNSDHQYFIHEYKDDVLHNEFPLQLHCIALSNEYQKELYNQHKKNVEEFELKYNINYE